jgi:multisubunit Na+/H+ antiporter MnhG subunit
MYDRAGDAMRDHLSREHEDSSVTIKGVVLSIMVIAIVFVLIRTLNPVYGNYIINQEYVTILLSLLVASVVIAFVLHRAQEGLYEDETIV